MSLDTSIKAGYAPGGVYYNNIKSAYGPEAADVAYRTSLTASQRSDITDALNKFRSQYADPGSESFSGNFVSQLYNDPLGAPIEQLGIVAKNASKAAIEQLGIVAKNASKAAAGNWGIWVLAGIAIIGFVFYLGGLSGVKKRFA